MVSIAYIWEGGSKGQKMKSLDKCKEHLEGVMGPWDKLGLKVDRNLAKSTNAPLGCVLRICYLKPCACVLEKKSVELACERLWVQASSWKLVLVSFLLIGGAKVP